MCEAGGMAPMLAKIAAACGVPVMSSGGFDSLTAKHGFAQEVSEYGRAEIRRHFVNFRELISFMREYVDKKIGATG